MKLHGLFVCAPAKLIALEKAEDSVAVDPCESLDFSAVVFVFVFEVVQNVIAPGEVVHGLPRFCPVKGSNLMIFGRLVGEIPNEAP